MDKWISVDYINNILDKALENCKEELTSEFYAGAKMVLNMINEKAVLDEGESDESQNDNGRR